MISTIYVWWQALLQHCEHHSLMAQVMEWDNHWVPLVTEDNKFLWDWGICWVPLLTGWGEKLGDTHDRLGKSLGATGGWREKWRRRTGCHCWPAEENKWVILRWWNGTMTWVPLLTSWGEQVGDSCDRLGQSLGVTADRIWRRSGWH